MIKTFCDVCYKEMEPKNESSVFAFITWKMTEGKGMTRMQDQEIYCDVCTSFIKSKLDEMRDDKKKYKEGGINAVAKNKGLL